jgi:DNA-directed RNA polymerase specialized sigma24 family protein
MAEQTDAWGQLLMAANAGDARAYARFLQTISPVLRGVVRAKAAGLGEAACEDVLQEVLLAIHLKRHTWDAAAPVRPWLYAITRYKVVDAFRNRGRKVDLPIEDFAEVLAAEAGPDPTEAADMAKMIGMLDGRSADIVRKIGLEGASVAETGVTSEAARSARKPKVSQTATAAITSAGIRPSISVAIMGRGRTVSAANARIRSSVFILHAFPEGWPRF